METGLAVFPARGFAFSEYTEYRLVVRPAKEISDTLLNEQENFFSEYNIKIRKRSLPHLTIAKFLASDSMEDTIIRWMQRIISGHETFSIMLNNYGGLPHRVFARVHDHTPFKRLTESLKIIHEYLTTNGYPPATLNPHPHVNIAKELPPSVYEKAIF